jgi:hypothetical protein
MIRTKNSPRNSMARILIDLFRYFIMGLVFWIAILFVWSLQADELPPRPQGHTVKTPTGSEECFPTDELRKIVLWVKTAEHLHKANKDLEVLLTNAHGQGALDWQEAGMREAQLRGAQAEIDRLRALVNEQQTSYDQDERKRKIRKALTWSSVGVLAAGVVAFGIAWGVAR